MIRKPAQEQLNFAIWSGLQRNMTQAETAVWIRLTYLHIVPRIKEIGIEIGVKRPDGRDS